MLRLGTAEGLDKTMVVQSITMNMSKDMKMLYKLHIRDNHTMKNLLQIIDIIEESDIKYDDFLYNLNNRDCDLDQYPVPNYNEVSNDIKRYKSNKYNNMDDLSRRLETLTLFVQKQNNYSKISRIILKCEI